MKPKIRIHRSGVEINDQKRVRTWHDLHHRYLLLIDARKRIEPLVEFQRLSLCEFIDEILRYGTDAMKLALEQKERKIRGVTEP